MFGEVGLVSGRVGRGRVSVGKYSARFSYFRDLIGEVDLEPAMFDEVGLMSVLVRRSRVSFGTCSAMSG